MAQSSLTGNEPRSLPLAKLCCLEPECGGGLLLLRHVTPLGRRNMVYFSRGAYTFTLPADQIEPIVDGVMSRIRGLKT